MSESTNTNYEIQNNLKDASAELNKLFLALSKAQAQIKPALKDKNNPFFKSKYADLESCWESVREALTNNELCVTQLQIQGVETVKIKTVLGHSSGQYISSITELKPVKNDPQGAGSAITYARRYGLMGVCGIAPEDDDGNAASKAEDKINNIKEAKKKPVNHAPVKKGELSEAQLNRLFKLAEDYNWPSENVKKLLKEKYKVSSSKDLTLKQYNEVCEIIQNHTL